VGMTLALVNRAARVLASIGDITIDNEHAEYRYEACKKEIRTRGEICTKCIKLYYSGCVNKHRIYGKNKELISSESPYENLIVEKNKEAMMIGMAKARHETILAKARL